MNKSYTRINWKDEPSQLTALSAVNLNKMDSALNEIDNRVINLDTSKANADVVNNVLKSVEYNKNSGTFLFTYVNGTTTLVDLNVEKIPASFSMDEKGVIHLYGDDGKEIGSANVAKLIANYEFINSTTIELKATKQGAQNVYSVAGEVIKGSLTDEHFKLSYKAELETLVEQSKTYNSGCKDYYDKIIDMKPQVDFTTGHLQFNI